MNKKEKPQSIIIRIGKPEDIPVIKECLINSWIQHAKQEPDLLDEDRMKASDIKTYYEQVFDKPENHFLFVAEKGGKFAGFIRADVKQIPDFFKHPKILFLDDTYVLQKFRRKGIAKQLLLKAEKLARKLRIKKIQSRVYFYNKPVQQMLKNEGYRSPHATWDKVLD